jgi:hypothetical protein
MERRRLDGAFISVSRKVIRGRRAEKDIGYIYIGGVGGYLLAITDT